MYLSMLATLALGVSADTVINGYVHSDNNLVAPYPEGYPEALANLDWDAVQSDIRELLHTSQDFWPADYGHYGPFMIRLAWHCTGSYRTSDGRGGCDGARQRFDPERSWDDNTNLDKARTLLEPIKLKYGLGLSWGDMIVLAGTIAIQDMGGPVLGFCAGRIDDPDGFTSEPLGPSEYQEQLFPCEVNGQCEHPLGSTTVGLIYVNPEGPMENPDPLGSAQEIRDTFGRMDLNDSETVALVGGGHAFGKTHGACPDGAGPSPAVDPVNPWPGICEEGVFTSGFEGSWTAHPTSYDNAYFAGLTAVEWEKWIGPGGHWQWRVTPAEDSPVAPSATDPDTEVPIMMLTSDIGLLEDPEYRRWVETYKEEAGRAAFDDAFQHAWYKLVARDMGGAERCTGPAVPDALDWQYPLPDPAPNAITDYSAVRKLLRWALHSKSDAMQPDSGRDGSPYYGAIFSSLAFRCAATYRQTDYRGGCNGARIRFSPEKDWAVNTGLQEALAVLQPIKDRFGERLSWADLIVLAGDEALASAGVTQTEFCGGRVDASASDGEASKYLEPRDDIQSPIMESVESMLQSGLSTREWVALQGKMRSSVLQVQQGFSGSWSQYDGSSFSNEYFVTLLGETWEEVSPGSGEWRAQRDDVELYMTNADMALRWDPTFLAIAESFASDNELFLTEFGQAWTKLMNANRFDGPFKNVCERPRQHIISGDTVPTHEPTGVTAQGETGQAVDASVWIALSVVGLALIVVGVLFRRSLCSPLRKPEALVDSIATQDSQTPILATSQAPENIIVR